MTQRIIICLFLAPLFAFAQTVPNTKSGKVKIHYAKKPIALPDPAKENPVLVVYENRSLFVKDSHLVTDTLDKGKTYQLFSNTDSIRRYTNSAFVKQVLLIETR